MATLQMVGVQSIGSMPDAGGEAAAAGGGAHRAAAAEERTGEARGPGGPSAGRGGPRAAGRRERVAGLTWRDATGRERRRGVSGDEGGHVRRRREWFLGFRRGGEI